MILKNNNKKNTSEIKESRLVVQQNTRFHNILIIDKAREHYIRETRAGPCELRPCSRAPPITWPHTYTVII